MGPQGIPVRGMEAWSVCNPSPLRMSQRKRVPPPVVKDDFELTEEEEEAISSASNDGDGSEEEGEQSDEQQEVLSDREEEPKPAPVLSTESLKKFQAKEKQKGIIYIRYVFDYLYSTVDKLTNVT
jgi:hypothetical protein